MLLKNLSLVAALCPRLSRDQYSYLLRHYRQRGLEGADLETLLKKGPKDYGWDLGELKREAVRLQYYLEQTDVHHVYPGHCLYPESLFQLDRPPLFFLLKGDLRVWEGRFLSVVGARRYTSDSAVWMRRELKPFVEREKICTVSGGAIGVDQEAHSLGAFYGAGTVAVLPSGLEQIYPKSLSLPESGALLFSEWLPWETVRPYYFKFRNRIISALSPGLLIIEAGEKSGTMLTADWAGDLGREIGVVPGSPLLPSYRGSLRLLQEGAAVITDLKDLHLWWQGLTRSSSSSAAGAL